MRIIDSHTHVVSKDRTRYPVVTEERTETTEWFLDHGVTVAGVAPNLRHTGWLDDALSAGPIALLGGSVPPPVVDRLVAQLQAVAATTVVAPTCFGCGTTRFVTQRVNGLRACNWCAIKARPERVGPMRPGCPGVDEGSRGRGRVLLLPRRRPRPLRGVRRLRPSPPGQPTREGRPSAV